MSEVMGNRDAVLLDAQPLWLSAIGPIVGEAGFDVVAACRRADDAFELVGRHRPALFVLDPASGGTAVIASARERAPALRVVAIGSSRDPGEIDAVLAAGAVAYVIKTAEPVDILAAIRQAFTASIFLPGPKVPGGPRRVRAGANGGPLTKRETEILRLVADGHPNVRLAGMLWVTEQTVKFHLSNIYRKLGVSNRTEASRWAQVNGLLGHEDDGGTAHAG
ncbi:MAG TPA: response regulator transcription factor [Gaiellaceae bacterium]|nr:response regulator transcription factor [Gaiellaceae bacterium]